jgi:hypothetical protein
MKYWAYLHKKNLMRRSTVYGVEAKSICDRNNANIVGKLNQNQCCELHGSVSRREYIGEKRYRQLFLFLFSAFRGDNRILFLTLFPAGSAAL